LRRQRTRTLRFAFGDRLARFLPQTPGASRETHNRPQIGTAP
jgi:hypothetical protein